MRRVLTLIAALAAVLLPAFPAVLLPAFPAAAAPADTGRVTFGVRPTNGRPTYAYAATPGGVFTDKLEVSNAGTTPLTLKVYAGDAFNPKGGGFDLLAAGHDSTDVGSWVSIAQPTVKVPARGKVLVPFRLTVPATATPGDHTGGIVAALTTVRTDAKGNRVAVEQRVGARLYLRISGALAPALTVEGLTARFHPSLNPFGRSTTTLTYRVRNAGNVRLGARQTVSVSTLVGGDRVVPGLADLPEILPGNAVDVTTEVHSTLPAIWLTSSVRAEPVAEPGDQHLAMTATTREHGFWAVSWTLLAVVAAVAALVTLGWRRHRRIKQRLAVADAPKQADHALV